MSRHAHKKVAPKNIATAIITVSDTRTLATDKSGLLIESLLKAAEHRCVHRVVVLDERVEIQGALENCLKNDDIQCVILNGGTGLSPRDVTVDAVKPLLDTEIPGFGELFRMLSYEEIGSAALLSRATAGLIRGKAIFMCPGSSGGVRLAMEKLIIPELGHIIGEATKLPKGTS